MAMRQQTILRECATAAIFDAAKRSALFDGREGQPFNDADMQIAEAMWVLLQPICPKRPGWMNTVRMNNGLRASFSPAPGNKPAGG